MPRLAANCVSPSSMRHQRPPLGLDAGKGNGAGEYLGVGTPAPASSVRRPLLRAECPHVGLTLTCAGTLPAVAAVVACLGLHGLLANLPRFAYVGVADGSFRLVNLTGGGHGIQVQLRLRNSGKSPAYDFTTWISGPVVAAASDEPFGPSRPLVERTSTSIVFADGDTHVGSTAPITPEQLQAVRAGTSKMFDWGGADYRDAFGVVRTLKFFDVNGLEVQPGAWPLQPHRKGYEAD
jgi:hypothetical protein